MTIVRPLNRFPVGYRNYLEKIIDDLHACQCTISKFIGDNPKRAIVREALNHASHYTCEYCTTKAGRTAVEAKSVTDIKGISEAITFLQEMSGPSRMSHKKEKHLEGLTALKKTHLNQK